MRARRRVFRGIAMVCLACVLATAAQASPVTYQFTGSIYEVSDPAGLLVDVDVGTPFSGWFTWNPATATLDSSSPGHYTWTKGPEDFEISVSVAGTTSSTIAGGVGVGNVIDQLPSSGGCCDTFQLSGGGDPLSNVGPLNLIALEVLFQDATKTVFDSRDLPTQLDLSDWTEPRFNFAVGEGSDLAVALGYVESLVLVPEPSTGVLLLLGLAVMARRRACPARR